MYERILDRSGTQCHVHKSYPSEKQLSLSARMFRRDDPYQSQIEVAHRFVMDNYQPGDYVILLGRMWDEMLDGSRYVAIRQLATHLDTGTTPGASRHSVPHGRVPVTCVYLDYASEQVLYEQMLQLSTADRILSDFPSTIENLLCTGYYDAYVIQRGVPGFAIRKETWMSGGSLRHAWLDWLMLQTGHVIRYDPMDLVDSQNPSGLIRMIGQPELLSTMTHLNCTKRVRGVPCDSAIPTGGQLTRLLRLTGHDLLGDGYECLVSSYRHFLNDEHDDYFQFLAVEPPSEPSYYHGCNPDGNVSGLLVIEIYIAIAAGLDIRDQFDMRRGIAKQEVD
ncbi:hypothetical protein BDV93DRAFT_589930 [Ceratobasidium sp. AG-I]|nr:hypothetical protein BDV93DRAFT_589930 [Ceratobasidium sp. AG-I]